MVDYIVTILLSLLFTYLTFKVEGSIFGKKLDFVIFTMIIAIPFINIIVTLSFFISVSITKTPKYRAKREVNKE